MNSPCTAAVSPAVCASLLLSVLAAPTAAQATVPQSGASQQGAAQPGVAQDESVVGTTPYPSAFFAQYQPQTALDMVNRVPGFGIAAGSAVRGYTGSQGNVLINGERPATKAETITVLLQSIPAAQVERIDLIRGGAPGIDMQGRPVVVNVIQKAPAATLTGAVVPSAWFFGDGRILPGIRLEATRRVSESNTTEFSFDHAGVFSDQWGAARRVQRRPDGSISSDRRLDIVADGSTDVLRLSATRPMFDGRVTGSLTLNRQDFLDEQILRGPAGDQTTVSDGDVKGGEAGLTYRADHGGGLTSESIFLQSLESGRNVQTSGQVAFISEEDSGESILRSRLTWERSPQFTLEGSIEGAYNFLDGVSEQSLNGLIVPLSSDAVLVEELRSEIQALGAWRPDANLTVRLGGRLEFSEIAESGDVDLTRQFVYAKPFASVAWTPRAGTQLRLRIERVVNQLSFNNFIASAQLANNVLFVGNPNLEPQKQWVYEGVLEHRFWDRGSVTVALRTFDIEDVIDLIPIARVSEAPGNIGDGWSQEAVITATVPGDRLGVQGLTLRGTGTWRDSQVTDPLTGSARPISFQRPFEGSLGVTYDSRRLKTTFTADLNAGWEERSYRLREVVDNQLTHWFQLAAEWRPSANYSVRIQYVDLDQYDRLRTIYAGPRDVSPLLATEQRIIPPPYRMNIRLRRAF